MIFFSLCRAESYAQGGPWPVPPAASAVKSPITITPAGLKEARNIYSQYCVPCHGDKGKGDGIAAAGLNPKPADHTSGPILTESDGSIYYKISEGRLPMPQFKTSLSETQRWELVAFIRTLAKPPKK